MNTHWWMTLPSIPSKHEDRDYRRLKKIWGDKTRFRGRDERRKHEFVTPTYETHLMTTLWENFSLFAPADWLQGLSDLAGVGTNHSTTGECDWSYGFREDSTKRIADIVVGFDGVGTNTGCYVIEAKRPGGKLGQKDLDTSYYLEFEEVLRRTSYRKLIYLVDPREKERVLGLFSEEPQRFTDCGVLTWEELGGLQIELAHTIEVPRKIRSFLAGAIQYQYCLHDILPSTLAEDYLVSEPSIEDVFEGIQNSYDNHDPQWARLGESYNSDAT